MGTHSTQDFNDHGDGNWSNPQIQAENQRAIHQQETQGQGYLPAHDTYASRFGYPHEPAPGAGYPQPSLYPAGATPAETPYLRPRKPPYRIFRRFFCSLLALFTLLAGLAGATAYWAQTTLVDTENFTALADNLATDQDFQTSLATAVTEDIMASPTISTYLGDGNSDAWYGGVQNWLYDQTYTLIKDTTGELVTSENYPELWSQAIRDSHRYNFSGASRPAQLDFSAIYDEAGGAVQAASGITLDTTSLPGRTLLLDTGQSSWPVNASINALIQYASLWPILLAGSAGSALLGFLLWPGSRFAHLACIAFIGAGLLWLAALVGGGASWLSGMGQGASNSGLLFFQGLSELIADSYANYHSGLAFSLLIAAVILTLLALLTALWRVTARPATARFR